MGKERRVPMVSKEDGHDFKYVYLSISYGENVDTPLPGEWG